MAESPGAVNVLRVARVDPDLHAVAVFDLRIAAPRRLLLAAHLHRHGQPPLAPGQSHVGKGLLAFQLAKTGQAMLLGQLDAAGRPQLVRVVARRREAEEHRRRH